jgi:hypothetical protein
MRLAEHAAIDGSGCGHTRQKFAQRDPAQTEAGLREKLAAIGK